MTASEAYDLSIAASYDRDWDAAADLLRAGAYIGEEPPAEGSLRWGVSVVVTMGADVGGTLGAVAENLRRRCRGAHLVYRRDDLHATVRSLEGYRTVVDEGALTRYADTVRTACRGVGPVRLRLRGLSGSPTCLLVRGYPGRGMTELRRRLHRIAAANTPPGPLGVDAARIRASAHVTLAVLRPEGGPEPELCAFVDANRATELGVVEATGLSIVRYDWQADRIAMRQIARIEIDGRQPRVDGTPTMVPLSMKEGVRR
jgi:hypothetical protein